MADFDEFVRANASSLHATAWLMCGDVEDARDLVQSGLLVLFGGGTTSVRTTCAVTS